MQPEFIDLAREERTIATSTPATTGTRPFFVQNQTTYHPNLEFANVLATSQLPLHQFWNATWASPTSPRSRVQHLLT